MHLIHRSTCRVCGSRALTPVINLGEQHLQGSFIKEGSEYPPQRKIALSLVRCDPTKDEHACGLLQMEHSVPPEILYAAYWYRSGVNRTMRDHLEGITKQALDMTGLASGAVLDIGCNDGTLLSYYPSAFSRFGVDPSNVAREVQGDYTIVSDLFPSNELSATLDRRKLDIITSIAMFYDLEDPVGFSKEIAKALAPEGLWVFEMSYMPSMLKMNSYDTICHEHLEYYSLAVIENILNRAEMKVVYAELNDINGGSIRCFATHVNNFRFRSPEYSRRISELRAAEFDLELDTDKPYRNFQDRINLHKEELNSIVTKLKRQGKVVHIYGASTKGNTILQWCGIDRRLIEYAAERNIDKFGASTIGTDIRIISEEESRTMHPDYYLVLPWHFKREFVEREQEALKNGTKMIFPLPEVEIIGH